MSFRSAFCVCGSIRPALWLLIALIALPGCIRRTISITSEPSGSLVYLNDAEVGRTPAEVPFTFYGLYDVRLEKAGYATLNTTREAEAPLADTLGVDLFTEMLPGTVRVNLDWHFELAEAQPPNERNLVSRGRQLRALMDRQIEGPGTETSTASESEAESKGESESDAQSADDTADPATSEADQVGDTDADAKSDEPAGDGGTATGDGTEAADDSPDASDAGDAGDAGDATSDDTAAPPPKSTASDDGDVTDDQPATPRGDTPSEPTEPEQTEPVERDADAEDEAGGDDGDDPVTDTDKSDESEPPLEMLPPIER